MASLFDSIILHKALVRIEAKLDLLLTQENKVMAQIDDLNAAVDTLSNTITSVNADVAEVLVLLTNAEQTGQPVDLSAVIAKLQNANAALTSVDASLKSVEPNPTGVDAETGKPATTGGPNADPNPVVEATSDTVA